MSSRRLLTGAFVVLAVLAGAFLGTWAARAAVSARLEGRTDPNLPSGRPAAVLPLTEWDFGEVSQGTPLSALFPVTNAGTRRLVLREEGSACCGQSTPEPVVVLPGDSDEIAVRVPPGEAGGPLRHVVRYRTNDPRLPRFALTVHATLDPADAD